MNEQRTTVGDVRGESLGEYWPLDLVGVQEGWIICNQTQDINAQIAAAREKGLVYAYGEASVAEDVMKNLKELGEEGDLYGLQEAPS